MSLALLKTGLSQKWVTADYVAYCFAYNVAEAFTQFLFVFRKDWIDIYDSIQYSTLRVHGDTADFRGKILASISRTRPYVIKAAGKKFSNTDVIVNIYFAARLLKKQDLLSRHDINPFFNIPRRSKCLSCPRIKHDYLFIDNVYLQNLIFTTLPIKRDIFLLLNQLFSFDMAHVIHRYATDMFYFTYDTKSTVLFSHKLIRKRDAVILPCPQCGHPEIDPWNS